jgi:polysaccharide biosynthesis/export protein
MKRAWILLFLLNGCYQTLPPQRPTETFLPPRQLSSREKAQQQRPDLALDKWLQQLQDLPLSVDTIQAGDAFNLNVYGEPELELKGAVVRPDGVLACPLIGDIPVVGLTVNAARLKIQQELQKYIQNPRPTLSPYQFSGRSITILGKVNRPGSYSLNQPTRVLDAIGQAGGFSVGIIKNDSTELADLRHAFMVRDKVVLPVDFEALVKQGKLQNNIPLQPGDYIYVPSIAQQEVYVLGEVYEQNSFSYHEGMTVSQALAYAKGPKDAANLNQILLARGRMSQPELFVLDFNAILHAQESDVLLQAGDVLYVTSGPLKNFQQIMQVALPALQAIQGGALLYELFRSRNGTASPP